MAGKTVKVSICMDADLKARAEALYEELGMSLSTAFNIFVRQSLREGGLPFQVKVEKLDKAVDEIRRHYGKDAIKPACLLNDLKMPGDGRDQIRLPGHMYT